MIKLEHTNALIRRAKKLEKSALRQLSSLERGVAGLRRN